MGIKFKNNAYGVLSATVSTTDTTISLDSGEGNRFPVATGAGADWFFATLIDTSNNREIILCTARASGSDTLTVLRAQDNTTARAFALDDRLEMRPNAGAMDTLNFTDVISAVSTATNTITIDNNEHAAFTNEISTGSSKNYSLVSSSGWYKIGTLLSSSEADGYASITIHNSVDADKEEPSRLEMQVSQLNGAFSGHAVVFGASIATDNVHIHVVKKTSETAPAYTHLDVYIMVHSNANAYISVRHFGGTVANWVKDLPSSITNLPAGYDTLWDSKDNLALTVSANGDTALKGDLTVTDVALTGNLTVAGTAPYMRVSASVKMNSSTVARQTQYTKNAKDDFGLTLGTIMDVTFEMKCTSAEYGFVVGSVLPMDGVGYADDHQFVRYWSSESCALANVAITTGDRSEGFRHIWNNPVAGQSSTANRDLSYSKWDIYCRIWYTN